MNRRDYQTTMICLFQDPDEADAAVKDLVRAGIPKGSIGVMGNSGTAAANPAAMEKWRVPEREARLLTQEMNKGGVVVALATGPMMADKVEAIFGRHRATLVGESVTESKPASTKAPLSNNATSGGKINVVEEEVTIGKREVQRNGVCVYQVSSTPKT